MPYFVFSVRPFGQLEKLAEFSSFKEASSNAKSRRAAQTSADGARIKVMFADRQDLAEDLLCQVREAGPSGDD